MTKKEASEKLKRQQETVCHHCVHPSSVRWCEDHCRLPEAFDMAIKALEAKPCEDAVSREAVLETIDKMTDGEPIAPEDLLIAVTYLPSAQQEKRTQKRTETHACDLISRQAAIDAILAVTGNSSVRELYEHVQEHGLSEMWSGGVNAAIDIIIAVPPAQPQRKRGKWIYGEDNPGTGRDGWLCSKCGHFEMWDYSADMKSAELNLPNYCPRCGADMRGEQDESD